MTPIVRKHAPSWTNKYDNKLYPTRMESLEEYLPHIARWAGLSKDEVLARLQRGGVVHTFCAAWFLP